MKNGLRRGADGADVERLHAVLIAAGYAIDRAELTRHLFGDSTLAALQSLQRSRGMQATEEIDDATLAILIEIERNITINIYEGDAPPVTVDPRRGHVHGTFTDDNGLPIAKSRLVLFEKALRSEKELGQATTDAEGNYSIVFRRLQPLNLVVRAYDAAGAVKAQSAVSFAVGTDTEIDLTTAKDGVIRAPSVYTTLTGNVSQQLGNTPLTDLQQNSKTQELTFLAQSISAPFADVAYLYIARTLAGKEALNEQTLFGLVYQGIPASLDAALGMLPDAGIDPTFTSQVMDGVLVHSRATLAQALTTSVSADVLPTAYAQMQSSELDRIDVLRTQNTANSPYIRGKTSLNDLLTAANVADPVKTAFAQTYASNGERLGPTWKALRANPALSKADLANLNVTLSAGELLGGNLPLLKDTLARIQQKSLDSLQSLALLDENDWIARITQLDPQATSIPPVLPTDTPQMRITRFAKALTERFTGRYATTAIAGAFSKAKTSNYQTKAELVTFLTANPRFNIRRANIDSYISSQKVTISAAATTELKAAQRLFRLSPHYTSIEALKGAGFTSAQSVYFKGRQQFIAEMTQPLGSAPKANMAYARAQVVYASALTAYGRYNLAISGMTVKAMASVQPSPGSLANLPSMQALFGSLDFFQCEDCQSVYSPAAYLVDLLQYLAVFSATGGGVSNGRDAFLARRPEVQYIALGCSNTNITLPYIDLVNEILESAIAPPAPTPTLIETTGSSAERRALPQSISLPAYALTATTVFPISLPFDLAFAQTTAYLAALGTSLSDVLYLFFHAAAGPSAQTIACARLGINPAMQAQINAVSATPWTRWGLAQNGIAVVDPKTRTLFPTPPATTDWVTALSKVPILVNRAGLTLPQLYQLLEVYWVTQAGVTLQAGTTTVSGIQILDANTDNMIFTGLTGDVLDRANRYLRLWNACGLQMWELDWALGKGNLDDTFLTFLSGALAVQRRLKIPFNQLLSFWYPLETRDVVNHLGDEDTVAPSTYTDVFRNPTILASPAFAAVFTSPSLAVLALSDYSAAVTAALGLSTDDISAILTATGTPAPLSTTVLNVLLQYARLSTSLSLSVPDLILWITLTEVQPFGTTPATTLEFLRRLDLLQGPGLGIHDLDYLLRGQSATQSAIAFTAGEATAVVQSVRDAVAKLPVNALANATSADTQSRIQTIVVQTLAAGTSSTANVVTPLLLKTGVLPLSQATITLLLQTPTVQAAVFPTLVAGFTQVAMGAALYTALAPTEAEFAFVVQNAPTFGWLDPSALPPAGSAYIAFEALVRAIKLDGRQAARTPKLFDVLTAWIAALPADVPTAINGPPALALALDASVADVAAIATSMGVTKPVLPAVAGSLTDIATLTYIGAALDIAARYNISGATLVQLATTPATAATASVARSAFQAQYPQSAWFAAVQPVEDSLRQTRRDALVAYLIGPGVPATGTVFLTPDDIYDYYLIDPEMCACASSTRLLQASLAIQQFVQQCFLNLFFQTQVDTSSTLWKEWSWRGQFRLWQANRQVFLYPENYVLPELRTNASPFFTDLESDLRQSNLDADAAETAFASYLRKLVEASRLVITAHYYETRADGSRMLHVFAHTRGTPPKWFYRARTELTLGYGTWDAWQPLNVDIAADNVLPFIWDQRLHLLWTIYKLESEKPKDQKVPSSGASQSTAQSYWAIELAMTEFSAGQWQPKRTFAEKIFIQKTNVFSDTLVLADRPPLAFTFRASQDAAFNLQTNVYYNLSLDELELSALFGGGGTTPIHVANAVISMPEAPAIVTETSGALPDASLVDLSREPSYALVQTGMLSGTLAAPNNYNFAGQDLVYGFYWNANPGSVPLYVLSQTAAGTAPSSVELLGAISNPHLVIPQQEPVFDSLEPFFVTDPGRGYLVQPEYFTIGSSPTELSDLTYVKQWSTSFTFQTFYHPYARTFLRELEIGGMDALMARNLQINPQTVRNQPPTFNFNTLYKPQPPVAHPYPGESQAGDVGETWLDFSPGSYGAYSLYNWELFYHGPMFVAELLMQNQRFQDTLTWLQYIFNPSDSSGGPAPQRFWEMAPFNALNTTGWADQQVQAILDQLTVDTQLGIQGVNDAATLAAIAQWMNDPFDPHAIASTRIGAYAKATVMKFLDNLIAWGDSLLAQYNAETVSRAEQLYILADLILGEKPVQLRLPDSGTAPMTYAALQKIDAFSNALVQVENVIVAPIPPQSVVNNTSDAPSLPQFPGGGNPSTLLFCIPPNDQLLAYWDTVADRLYKIRHCMNLQGVVTPLPLYAPPINPLLLVEGAASGGAISGTAPTAPVYRFQTYLQKAVELGNDVRAFGSLILAALEKKDAESLALLRANQELDIQTRLLDIKNLQATEAQDQVTALQNQQAVIQVRYDFYSNIAFMNDWEISALSLQAGALIANAAAVILDMTSGVAHVVPNFQAGAVGFGGSPMATFIEGGDNVGKAATSWASVARGLGGLLGEAGGIAGTLGGYYRRSDDWKLQANLAQAELTQIASQITAANDRVSIAQGELDLQSRQIDNAQAVSDFLTNKYTSAQLYNWMITQLTTVYTQAYQLAFSLAQQAQNAYQYELGRPQDTFIQFGYWNSQYKGLTAGESLTFDLRRMEVEYLNQNIREQEVTKHVSLALTQPAALVQLRETGSCQVNLDEILFDRDNPGQYFRRLRSVAVTIPCVAGPYASVNATLTLTSALVRVTTPGAGYAPTGAGSPGDGVNVLASATPATATIVTSTAQNDAGLFDVSLRDERWLPFEGQGAISQWSLVLDPRDNTFDVSTATDVILHVRYTARGAGNQAAANIVRAAIKPLGQRSILVSIRNTFGDAWYTFLNPVDSTATQQVLTLPLSDALFPFANTGALKLVSLTFLTLLTKAQPGGTTLPATLGPTGGAGSALAFTAATGTDTAGDPIAALSSAEFATTVAPESFSVTVPSASIPASVAVTISGQTRLDKTQIKDMLLLIKYTVG